MRTCRDPNQRTKVLRVRQFGNSSFDWMCPLEYTVYITIVHIYICIYIVYTHIYIIYSIQMYMYVYIWYNGDSRDFSICQGSRLLWERWKQGILSLFIEPRAVSQPPNQNWWFMITPTSFLSDGTMVSRGVISKMICVWCGKYDDLSRFLERSSSATGSSFSWSSL